MAYNGGVGVRRDSIGLRDWIGRVIAQRKAAITPMTACAVPQAPA
jgi:hypothetical protein